MEHLKITRWTFYHRESHYCDPSLDCATHDTTSQKVAIQKDPHESQAMLYDTIAEGLDMLSTHSGKALPIWK